MIGPPVGSPPLVPATLQPQYGLIHFGLRTDDLEKAVDELKAKGMIFVQDITPMPSGSKISYFLAPENVLVELQQYSDLNYIVKEIEGKMKRAYADIPEGQMHYRI